MNNDIIYKVRKGINSKPYLFPKFNNENKFFDQYFNLHSFDALNLVGPTILALIKFIVRKSKFTELK